MFYCEFCDISKNTFSCKQLRWLLLCIQKISSIHKFILRIQQILGSHELKRPPPMVIFDYAYTKITESTFSFSEFLTAFHVYSICSFFEIKVNFIVSRWDWQHPFLTMLTSIIFSHLLICKSLHHHTKNHLFPLFHSWDKVNFTVQIPDRLYPFLTIPNF